MGPGRGPAGLWPSGGAPPDEAARAGVASALFHALRNVVTGIRGELELAEDLEDPAAREVVQALHRDTERLTALLRALDGLRHFDAGVPRRLLDVTALGESAATVLRELLPNRTTVVPPGPEPRVEARVEVRATRELVVAIAWALAELDPAGVEVVVTASPPRLAFSVGLPGEGPDVEAWLGRAGRGLAACAAAARAELEFERTDTRLAIVVTLPDGEDPTPATEPPHTAAAGAGRSTTGSVLVLEDREDVATFVERTLLRAGWSVHTVATCAEAVDRARGLDDVVLVVADVMLPDGVGPEAVRRIRERQPTARALYMTGYAQDLDVLAHGGAHEGLLMKPFTGAELVRAVSSAIGAPPD
ncbi:MAG: response regulator [Actinomycetes bacterium]